MGGSFNHDTEGITMTLTPYSRGYHDGAQAIVRLVCENMTRKRPGTMPSISLERFDSLVERHLEAVGLPPDPLAVPAPLCPAAERTAGGATAGASGTADAGEGTL